MRLNQNPEQRARDKIDQQLTACGWVIQNSATLNPAASLGVAVREYGTDVGPADYVLFVNRKPVGIIEAKREEEALHLSMHEEQTEAYASAKLKYCNNEKLPFVYESTGEVTRFTDFRDPKPRARPVFNFHRPETFYEWLRREPLAEEATKSLRARFHDLPPLAEDGLRDCQVTAIRNLENSFR